MKLYRRQILYLFLICGLVTVVLAYPTWHTATDSGRASRFEVCAHTQAFGHIEKTDRRNRWRPYYCISLQYRVAERRRGEIGRANQPCKLNLEMLWRHHGPVEFRLQVDGFQEQVVTLQPHYFDDHDRYPERGELQLDPTDGILSYARWYIHNRPGRVTATVAALLVALGLAYMYAQGGRRYRLNLAASLGRLERLHAMSAASTSSGDSSMVQLVSYPPGILVAGYVIRERLGEGGSAEVYRVIDQSTLDESFSKAMKILRRDICQDDDFRRRFEREYRISSRLLHPNIVTLYDSGSYEDRLYFVMELVEGTTLREVMPAGQPLALDVVLQYLAPLIEALSFMHDQGIVHRDLKPENLMVTRSGRLKVMDFGLSVAVNASVNATQPGTVTGTPRYMSPEQVLGKLADPRTDQYAVGTLAYEMLSGRVPFEDENIATVMFKQVFQAPEPLATVCPDLPLRLANAIDRMLAKEADDRFPDLRTAWQELSGVVGQGVGSPAPAASPTVNV